MTNCTPTMSDLDRSSIQKIEIKHFSVKTLHSSSKNSHSWKYFGTLTTEKDGKKRAILPDNVFCSQCILEAKEKNEDDLMGCCKIKSYSAKVSTGNLSRHLRDEHNLKEPEKAGGCSQRITAFFDKRPQKSDTSQPIDSDKKWLLARDLTLWICRSLLPFDMVSDQAMIDFFLKYNVIHKKEDLPSRSTISRTALEDVYDSMKAHIKDLINKTSPRSVALTTDLWSDAFQRNNYITLTLHFLSSFLDFESVTLATQIIEGKKTGENIKQHIQELLIEYELEEKKTVMVTDCGSNVKKAASLSDIDSHFCLGHGLHNLVVQDGVKSTPEINNIVSKCKKIVKSLRYKLPELKKDADEEQRRFLTGIDEAGDIVDLDESSAFNEETEEHGENTNKFSVTSIKTATPTRWHSILVMLESIHNTCNRNPIHRLLVRLNKSDLKIDDSEWKLLGDLIKFLKSFRDAVNILSASNSVTINVALVFRCEIEQSLKQTGDDEVLIMSRMKKNMLAKFNHRFPINKLIVAAALLDCRFQGMTVIDKYLEERGETRVSFMSAFVREHVKESDILQETVNEHSESVSSALITQPSTSSSSNFLLAISQKYTTPGSNVTDDPVVVECWKYFSGCDPKDVLDGNILRYWKEKKNSYPWLFNCVRAIMSVPATSTPSERVFSVAGLTITAKRSRLSPTSVDKIIFIHDNYDLCKKQVQKLK